MDNKRPKIMKPSNYKKRNYNNVTKEQLLKALSKAGGMKTIAANMLDKSPAWMTEKCKDPEVIEYLRKVEDERLDRYEHALDKLMLDGNTSAIIFYLKTKGRGRGYIEHAPAEIVNVEHLNALKDFFSSVPKKEPSASSAAPPQDPEDESHDLLTSQQESASASVSTLAPHVATQSAPACPGLSPGKIVRLGSNFP